MTTQDLGSRMKPFTILPDDENGDVCPLHGDMRALTNFHLKKDGVIHQIDDDFTLFICASCLGGLAEQGEVSVPNYMAIVLEHNSDVVEPYLVPVGGGDE